MEYSRVPSFHHLLRVEQLNITEGSFSKDEPQSSGENQGENNGYPGCRSESRRMIARSVSKVSTTASSCTTALCSAITLVRELSHRAVTPSSPRSSIPRPAHADK